MGRLRRALSGDPAAPLAALVLALALAQAWGFSGRWANIDFYQFWAVGQAVREPGAGDVYSEAERARLGQLFWSRAQAEAPAPGPGVQPPKRLLAAGNRRVLETYSTPWLYTLFGLASGGDYDRDLARFHALGLAVHVAAVLALARLLGFSWSAAFLAAALLTAWFAPALSDVRVGNVNRLQLGLLALVLALLGRERWRPRAVAAGVVLGLAVAFKPNLAFPAVVLGGGWLVLGRWRGLVQLVGGSIAGALLAVLLSSWYFGGTGAWASWAGQVPALMREYDHAVTRGNYALPKLLEVHLGVSPGALLALVFLASPLAVAWRARASGEVPRHLDVLLVGFGGAASLLSAKLAWLHYFLLLVPLLLWALRPVPGEAGERGRAWLRGLALASLVLVALDWLRPLAGVADTDPEAALAVCAGALLLFGTSLVDGLRSAARPGLAAAPGVARS